VFKILFVCIALFFNINPVWAQSNEVFKIVVPFAPGGPIDLVARIIQPALAKELGKTVIIENRAGAGGTIGVGAVATSAPDGKTLLLASGAFVLSAGTMSSLPYDPRKDLEPIALMGQVQTVLVVRPSLDVNSLNDLVNKGRNGAKFNFGSSGMGSSMHIASELINLSAGTHFQHVPYKGAALAINDLMGGNIDFLIADLPVLAPFIKDGKLKALVICDSQRSSRLPQIPHAVEAGLPELQMNNWYGLMMPAGVSVKVKSDMELALLKAFRAPEIAYRLTDLGLSAPGDAATFKNKLNAEFEKWIPVIRKAGIRSE